MKTIDPVLKHIGRASLSGDCSIHLVCPSLHLSRLLVRPRDLGRQQLYLLLQRVGLSVGTASAALTSSICTRSAFALAGSSARSARGVGVLGLPPGTTSGIDARTLSIRWREIYEPASPVSVEPTHAPHSIGAEP